MLLILCDGNGSITLVTVSSMATTQIDSFAEVFCLKAHQSHCCQIQADLKLSRQSVKEKSVSCDFVFRIHHNLAATRNDTHLITRASPMRNPKHSLCRPRMYRRLYNILVLFVILWVSFSIFSDLVRRGASPNREAVPGGSMVSGLRVFWSTGNKVVDVSKFFRVGNGVIRCLGMSRSVTA